EHFVVAHRLHRLSRIEAPLPARPRERRSGVVESAEQLAEAHENLVAPHVVGEAQVEPPAVDRDELDAAGHVALDEHEHLATVFVEAERTRRTVKSGALEVLQEVDDRRRPLATAAPNGVTDAHPDARRPSVGHVAWGHEVDLRVGHRRFLAEPPRGNGGISAWVSPGPRRATPRVARARPSARRA